MESRKIKILFENFFLEGELFQGKTPDKLLKTLPVEESVNLWGDEIYFTVAINENLDESAKEVVDKGDIGFWPEGPALCFFFGPTPISPPDKIVPASAVNIVGHIDGDLSKLKTVKNGEKVRIEII